MKIPVRPNHLNIRAAYQEKAQEREAWHKLAVKVIIWKDELAAAGATRLTDKISLKEWNTYYTRVVATNISYGREKVLADLKETWQKIFGHGGFE